VSSPNGLLSLDTNVVVFSIKAGAVARKIALEAKIREYADRPLISAITAGELLAFAQRNNWGIARMQRLKEHLSSLVVVGIDHEKVIASYAAIDTFQKKNGLNIGQNDVWIAATARAIDACLITTDRDFDCLHGQFVNRVWIDPKTSPPAAT
jgi:tRNA(fMet)-specific endonuclease VapC